MDLRVLVLIKDKGLAELVRAQVDNLGCTTSVARTYDEGSTSLSWAEAAVIDLADGGLDDLNRLRVEAPMVRVLAIAPDQEHEASAQTAGVHRILSEPFSVADLVSAVRGMARRGESEVVDLRDGEKAGASPSGAPADEAPWWATR